MAVLIFVILANILLYNTGQRILVLYVFFPCLAMMQCIEKKVRVKTFSLNNVKCCSFELSINQITSHYYSFDYIFNQTNTALVSIGASKTFKILTELKIWAQTFEWYNVHANSIFKCSNVEAFLQIQNTLVLSAVTFHLSFQAQWWMFCSTCI